MEGKDIALFIIGQLITSAAIWGAIRADIRALHERVKMAHEAANQAHKRLDTFMQATGSHVPYRRHDDD